MTGFRRMTGARLPVQDVGAVRYVGARTSDVWSAPRVAEERSRNQRRIEKMRRANIIPAEVVEEPVSYECVLGTGLPAGLWEAHLRSCRYCSARWT